MAKFTLPTATASACCGGQVVLATFPNENGLEAVSGTAWVQTGESGTPLIGVPGSGTCGTLSSGRARKL